MELNMVARREAGGAYPPSSPMVVRGCRLNTRESPARVAGLRGGLVQRAASSLSPNELCELPAGFSSGWLLTAAQAALGRRFGSHQLQFDNTAFSKTRAQKTSDSNRSLARVESKTSRDGGATRSTSKSSFMISRISRSLGAGFVVTKLPQTKTRRSLPVFAASSTRACNRPNSHTRLAVARPKRDWNSCQPVACTPLGRSPSELNSGSMVAQYQTACPSAAI